MIRKFSAENRQNFDKYVYEKVDYSAETGYHPNHLFTHRELFYHNMTTDSNTVLIIQTLRENNFFLRFLGLDVDYCQLPLTLRENLLI